MLGRFEVELGSICRREPLGFVLGQYGIGLRSIRSVRTDLWPSRDRIARDLEADAGESRTSEDDDEGDESDEVRPSTMTAPVGAV